MSDKDGSEVFTFYFNLMIYLGCWSIKTKNPVKKFLYSLYTKMTTLWVCFVLYTGLLDLIDSYPDINRMCFNACFHPFILFIWLKRINTINKSSQIDDLRWKLLRSVNTCKDQEEREIFYSAVRDIKNILRIFYFFFVWLFPAWFILSTWDGTQWRFSFPAKWPWDVDMDRLRVFISISAFYGTFGIFFIFEALSLEVSFFGLLTQICREYRFLIKKVHEFGDLHDMERRSPVEINRFLKMGKDRQMLEEIITRQKELLEYTEVLASCYKTSMFVHVFIGGAWLIASAIQAMIVSFNLNLKIYYQFGYVVVILTDMWCLCSLCSKVSVKCSEVGTALYSIPWYTMDVSIQKDIFLVILRAQKPPRITAGNFVELNLLTFKEMMKNMYSCLALYRQVVFK